MMTSRQLNVTTAYLLKPTNKLEGTKYNQLLTDNITKAYKKADGNQLKKKKFKIDDRVEVTAWKESFITLKDHNDNFANKPTYRLINPSKQEIGKISKQVLDDINQKVVAATNVNQWKNTSSMLKWYKSLPNKRDSAFISFYILEFYPSITKDLLRRTVDFTSNYVTISAEDRRIIIHAKQSLLFKDETPWQKRNSNTLFDVTMLRRSRDMRAGWVLSPVTTHTNSRN